MSEDLTAPDPEGVAGHTASEDAVIDRYLAAAARFKIRRLAALIVICGLLIITLIVIYLAGWYRLTGSATAAAAWIGVGVGVGVAAIVAVVIDIIYRKEA